MERTYEALIFGTLLRCSVFARSLLAQDFASEAKTPHTVLVPPLRLVAVSHNSIPPNATTFKRGKGGRGLIRFGTKSRK